MEKKKLKLSISGSSKKTFSSIEQAKSKSKNTVVIEKRNNKFPGKSQFSKQNSDSYKTNKSFTTRPQVLSRPTSQPSSDFEKRKLAEQRATRRLKGEISSREDKPNKIGSKRRELKLTVSRALSENDVEMKSRSLASLKRAKQKENRNLNQTNVKDNFKQIKREVNLPEVITIRELANRMAEQSSNIIKHLLGMGVTVTINHTIDADTAEYLVKEFGHNPIREMKR